MLRRVMACNHCILGETSLSGRALSPDHEVSERRKRNGCTNESVQELLVLQHRIRRLLHRMGVDHDCKIRLSSAKAQLWVPQKWQGGRKV
jgi:hypothetical protein